MSEFEHVRIIARTELRRRWRAIRETESQVIAIALVAVICVPFSLLVPVGGYLFGVGIADGSFDAPLELVRSGLVYAWIVVAGFSGYRAYQTALRPDRVDGMLTTVSHRELVGGIALAEVLLWGVPVGLVGAVGALAFALGSRSVLAAPLSLLAVVTTLTTALTTGFLLALAVRNAGVRSKLLTRLRSVFLLILGLAYVGVFVTQNVGAVLEPIYVFVAPTPLGWLADLTLVGTSPAASVGRAVGAVVAGGAVLVVGSAALTRLAARLWYADGVHVTHGTATAERVGGEPRLATVLSRPVAGVVLADWKRARRAPITLSFALYPLVVLLYPVASVAETGTVGRAFPLWLVVCGAWTAGALFSLNVVGNEGAAAPTTILTPTPGRSLVGGHVAAGALPLVPVTVALSVGLGLASPYSLAAVATLAASAVVLVCCAGPIASGIGVAFPRFEAVSVARSTKAIVPSTLAFTVYSVAIGAVALPTVLGHSAIVGHALASLTGTSQPVVAAVGTALTGLLAAVFAAVSTRYALRSVDGFRID